MRGDDITTPPPLSQDTPPNPWTPPTNFGQEASRAGFVDAGVAGSGSSAAPPRQDGPPWAGRGHRQHPYRHGSPILGPILLIGAGVVFLLNNTGVLPWSIWGQLWRLWPLILVAIGLDMLLGRRSPLMSLAVVVLVLGGGAWFLHSTGAFDPGNLVQSQLKVPLNGAKSADITVKMGTGELNIDGTEREQIASGTLQYYDKQKAPSQDVNPRSDAVEVTLEQHGDNIFGWLDKSPRWDLHLNPNVPITLNLDSGTGNTNLDLRSLKLQHLEVDSGTGNTTLRLPGPSSTLNVNLDAGTGNFDITIPEGVEARITIDTGTGNVTLPSRFTKKDDETYISEGYQSASNKLDLTIDLGTGNVEIR